MSLQPTPHSNRGAQCCVVRYLVLSAGWSCCGSLSGDVCTPIPVAALAHQHSGPKVSASGAACSPELHGLAYLAGETAKGLDLEPLFQGGCPIQGWALGLYAQADKWKLEMHSARLA